MKLNPEFDPAAVPPHQLTRLWEEGAFSREEYHAAMAVHARRLIGEMEEAYRNPLVEYLERLLNQRAARRLSRRHGEAAIREVLEALSDIPEFPPAIHLWNAGHWHVPLHCFIRTRWEPVFRVVELQIQPMRVKVLVEYGSRQRRRVSREVIQLRRNTIGRLGAEERLKLR